MAKDCKRCVFYKLYACKFCINKELYSEEPLDLENYGGTT